MRGRSCIIKGFVATLAGALILAGAARPAQAQGTGTKSPSESGIRLGSVALSPIFRLTEFGTDSNVFNRSGDNHPVGDFTFRLTPSLKASLLTSHYRASGSSQFDMYYYKALPDLRAIDGEHSGQFDLLLNRVTLSVFGKRLRTSHRQNLEIDAIVESTSDEFSLGAAVQVTGKTSILVGLHRSHLAYDENAVFLGSDLSQLLNYGSGGQSVGIRYAVTPLTTVTVEASRDVARFNSQVDRNAQDLLIVPAVSFSPFAIVSGKASVGFFRRTSPEGLPPFVGANVFVDLSYVLLGRTRFAIAGHRDLRYSYLAGPTEYTETGADVTVTQRLGESWDVVGTFGRFRLIYRPTTLGTVAFIIQIPGETVLTWRTEVGYNMRRSRVGVYVDSGQRNTDQSERIRGYERYRVGSTATYFF